ncbi:hypothetical protein [Actinopolymorpha singaporensis]|uniref:SWI/SNF-related matrix-associated actin-dependent regulator of chromatin subfamily A containing DEAD/H box 1 n=1 Tax=Actinopolymorpha singaporensis TaxID=117157 RepID=A0A1H1UZ97_9ACTN|nr:hypothetical protein [Actinopolymorpha singaporensis]SDS77847.1 SWI/SNF-related matrix-associated actin-dependent regulator of chromatin subfamily A containing DEAD/H box 1 [Actinopolymorpha singaporensis]
MAENLADRARARLAALTVRRDAIGDGLAAARAEVDRRHPDPASVPPENWATELGATQHVAIARAALASIRADQDRIRAALAEVDNPADTATFEAQLRDALIADAELRVRLREATERAGLANSTVAEWSALVGRAATAVGVAESEVAEAARRQADADALRTALGQPPLDTVVGDAAAVDRAAAADRLAELLPDELRDRALARAAEAEAVGAAAADAEAAADASRSALQATAHPLAAASDEAERAFLRALADLRRYAATASAELATARAALAGVAALPDLSTAQQEALDPANRTEAVAAAAAEGALAAAVAALSAAQRAVDDATVAALLADPDADPLQDAGVKGALQTRDGPAIQGPLATARENYDDDARTALDEWEVEVPDRLWRAAVAFAASTSALDRLADQAARDALVSDLDSTGDALANAQDARAEQVRRDLAVGAALAPRAGAVAALRATQSDRAGQYVRGDGPGGRTTAQL